MVIKLFQQISWYLQQGVDRFSPLGGWGLGILLLCSMVYAYAIQPKVQQLAILEPIVAARKPILIKERAGEVATYHQQQLTSFYAFFPARPDMVGQVESLFATAKKYHLNLENGTYELIAGKGHQLTRCEVQLPIRGSYVQTRRFLAEVMQDMPNVALTAFEIHREKIGASVIDAQIKLTMYYRAT